MTALLFQLLKHGWQPLRELWREGGVEEDLFKQRNKSYGAYQLRRNEGWYLLTAFSIVISGVLSLGWASTELARKKAEPEESLRILRISQARLLPLPAPGFCDGPAPPPPPPPIFCTRGPYPQIPVPAPLEEIEGGIMEMGYGEIIEPKAWYCTFLLEQLDSSFEFDTTTDLGDTLKSLEPQIPTEWLIPEITEEEELIFEASNEMPKHNEFIFCDQEPKVLNMKEAIEKHPLPHILQSSCFEGYVIFRVLVSADGIYLDHKVITGVHPILTTYFAKVVPDLRFEPANCEGENIAFWVNIPMNYKILN